MFDHDNRIAICRESAQDFRQLVHICKMKSGCRFIQNVHCLPSASPAQFSCKLDPLCFTAGTEGRIALDQTGFPDAMGERVYYRPVARGMELKLKDKLDALRAAREQARAGKGRS